LDPTPCEVLQRGHLKNLFFEKNFVSGKQSSANVYSKGKSDGIVLMHEIQNSMRSFYESCDYLAEIICIHAASGGTGSGLTTSIMENVYDWSRHVSSTSFVLCPNEDCKVGTVAPYNAVMAINEQKELFNMVVNFDNAALYKLVTRAKTELVPTYSDLNYAIASFLSGYSSGYRFGGHICSSTDTVYTNLIPFPAMNQMIAGCELYLCSEIPQNYFRDSMNLLFDERMCMISINPKEGEAKILSHAMMYSGERNVYSLIRALHETAIPATKPQFTDFIPCHTKLLANFHGIKQPKESPFYPGSKNNLVTLINGTAINQVFNKVFDQFKLMKKHRAFFHWYTESGLAVETFDHAEEAMQSLIDIYSLKDVPGHDEEKADYSADQ